MEPLPMAPLAPFVRRHALAIDRDAARQQIVNAFCSFCGSEHAICAQNLAAARASDPRLKPEALR